MCVMHFRKAASTEAALNTSIIDHFVNAMLHSVRTTTFLSGLETTKLDGVSASVHFAGEIANGQSGGDTLIQVCQIIQFRTAVRGPRGRGRIFLPFIGEGDTQNGVFSNATRSSVAAAWATALTGMFDDDGWQAVVASYAHSDANDITDITVAQVTGTQKRRLNQLR